jgi:hypothetical protein
MHRCRRILFLVCAALGACTFDPGGLALDGDDDDGGGLPDGGMDLPDAGPPPPDGMPCSPSETMCLGAGMLQQCTGGELQQVECPLGCLSGPAEPHCAVMQPSNGLDPGWLDASITGDLTIPGGTRWVFDADTGIIRNCAGGADLHSGNLGVEGGVGFQVRAAPAPGAIDMGVWTFDRLRIEQGAEIRIIGFNTAGLMVRGELRVEGLVTASGGAHACSLDAACSGNGDPRCGGPGGGDGGDHVQPGTGPGGGKGGQEGSVGIDETGGGGGAYGALGGDGGTDLGGPGGTPYGAPELDPVDAGSGGGGGGESSGTGGDGGGGGGGLMLVSFDRVEVAMTGGVNAGGAGGQAGIGANGNGGGGGGSGGAVLIESPRIRIAGKVAANGGGGGGGDDGAMAGQPGQLSNVQALGGTGPQPGGAGGSGIVPDGQHGLPLNGASDGAGGGGGSVGRIFLRSRPGGIDLSGSTVSPSGGQGMIAIE